MPYLGSFTSRAIILSHAAKTLLRLIIGVLVSTPFMPLAMAEDHRSAPNSYRDAIAQAERELGAQHYAVVEPAVGLGLNLQRNNQHADAIDALERALHVNRINKGLHHLDHIPIVDMIG